MFKKKNAPAQERLCEPLLDDNLEARVAHSWAKSKLNAITIQMGKVFGCCLLEGGICKKILKVEGAT